MAYSGILVILGSRVVWWANVVYAERTRADPSMLGVHNVRMAYVEKLQTLIFRVWSIYKHHYSLIYHFIVSLKLRIRPSSKT